MLNVRIIHMHAHLFSRIYASTNRRKVACVVGLVVCGKLAIVIFVAMYWRQLLGLFMSVALSVRREGRIGYAIVSLLTFLSAFPPIPSLRHFLICLPAVVFMFYCENLLDELGQHSVT